MKANTIQSILARIIKQDTGCWEWPGRRCSGHYGQCSMSGKLVMVHRVVWQHFNGPIPEGHELDHVCRNRICVWPDPNHVQSVPMLKNRGRYQPYIPPARIDPSPFRKCSHGNQLVTQCPQCIEEYRPIWNAHGRRANAAKTTCRKGHPLIEKGQRSDGARHRYCPVCLSNAGKKGGYPSQKRSQSS